MLAQVDQSCRCTFAALLLLCAGVGCQPPPSALEAQRLLNRGRLDAAKGEVERGVAKDPDSFELHKIGIEVHIRRGSPAAALKMYRSWVKSHGEDEKLVRHIALSTLRWGLKHRDPAVRLAALQGARETDAAPLEQDVAERLADPNEVVCAWAAVAMSQTQAGADMLGRQLRSTDPRARAVAVENLSRIAGKAAISALSRFVTDPAPRVRSALARGLPLTKSKEALPLLTKLVSDKDKGVRVEAIRALGTLGLPQGVSAVSKALKDPYPGVRVAAVIALADLQSDAAKPALAKIAAGDDLSLALRAGVRLSRMGSVQPVLNAIARTLVSRQWTLRVAGCNAAGSVKDRVALRLVARVLKDPEPAVRIAAARAVFAHNRQEVGLITVRSLHSLACGAKDEQMESLCLQAAELLTRAGKSSGRASLARLSHRGKTPTLRISALRSALALGAHLSVALKALPDKDPKVRVAAAIQIYKRAK